MNTHTLRDKQTERNLTSRHRRGFNLFHASLLLLGLSSDLIWVSCKLLTSEFHNQMEDDEEEYVLLDLDGVSGQVDIPPNAPYVLSGLDTKNPVLIINNKFKLIGEYEETIGTCFVFTEGEAVPVVHEETGPSDANLFSGKLIIDPEQASAKEVRPVARLHKILKFRLLLETNVEDATTNQTTTQL